MRNEKINIWLGWLFTTILLVQLSYHTIHVFTSHTHDSHIENFDQEIAQKETSPTCELCAKLLGQTVYALFYPTLFFCFLFSLSFIITRNSNFDVETLGRHTHRGPPSAIQ